MIRIASVCISLLVFLLFAAAPAPALAQDEAVSQYASDITIARNGTLTVREQITVRAAGERIRHGIFRDFPTSYIDRLGNRVRVGFTVKQVTRDGHDEPYTIEGIENGVRVRIGSADVELDPGTYVYSIVYTTTRQIGFFPDHDELYWNVTGNAWVFPIDAAQAIVHLPSGAEVQQVDLFTGPQGATEKNGEAQKLTGDTAAFRTTAPLGAYEGLTIAVAFNKGVVTPPTAGEKAMDFVRDNAAAGAALAGLLALTVYYLYVWSLFGRDPRRGTIVPLFAPPKDFSAASVRFVHKMAYDRKAFAAAIIAMAVKGYLTIAETDGTYTLTRTGKSPADTGLAATERTVANALFNVNSSIELKNYNHETVSRAITALQYALKREDEGVYFVTNLGWFAIGVGIMIASGVAAFALSPNSGDVGSVSPLAILLMVAQIILSLVFYRLLKAPTATGAKIRDQIDGFRMFLMTAEKDRLEILQPPQVTPEVFEKFLPYAIALDAENAWSRKFEADAARASMGHDSAGGGYIPLWYTGNSFNRLGTTGFVSSLGSSVAGATAAAATAPGRSSGFGGGGSSGGGGGGGGGGGW